jgi:hypothetical protein
MVILIEVPDVALVHSCWALVSVHTQPFKLAMIHPKKNESKSLTTLLHCSMVSPAQGASQSQVYHSHVSFPNAMQMHKTPYNITHNHHAHSNRIPTPTACILRPHNPKLFLTLSLTILSYSARLSLHMRAASTFAGDSSFGSANMLITLMRIFSTLWIGDHRSEACS